MIGQATCSSILKEGHIMSIRSSSANQIVAPEHVWVHLSTDLQVQVVRLLAQLAAHLVIADGERVRQTRKETLDVLLPIPQQDPA